MLPQIRFVLIGTTHPGNIGGVARAMKCMNLSNLALVAPKYFPHAGAYSRAAGAEDILDGADVYADVKQAIAECVFVVGTTARKREIEWPVSDPRSAARRIVAESDKGPVAVLFGQERSGLTNREVDLCHLLVRIPTNEMYASLNLASAAQIISYELNIAANRPPDPRDATGPLPDRADMDRFYTHLEQTLLDIDFIKMRRRPEKLMRKLVRLFNRTRPTDEEINILRGILTAAQQTRREH